MNTETDRDVGSVGPPAKKKSSVRAEAWKTKQMGLPQSGCGRARKLNWDWEGGNFIGSVLA